MAAPRDTSPDAWERVIVAYRAMRPAERGRLALELSEEVKGIARAGIAHRHPDWSATRVEDELAIVMLGPALARSASTSAARRPAPAE